MFARMLLLASLVALTIPVPASAEPSTPPVREERSATFPVTVFWINPSIDRSSFTIACREGADRPTVEITVPADRMHYTPDATAKGEAGRTYGEIQANVASVLPRELDRIKKGWKTLADFRYGQYRAAPTRARERPTFIATVYVYGDIHQMDLETTWNPHHDKD